MAPRSPCLPSWLNLFHHPSQARAPSCCRGRRARVQPAESSRQLLDCLISQLTVWLYIYLLLKYNYTYLETTLPYYGKPLFTLGDLQIDCWRCQEFLPPPWASSLLSGPVQLTNHSQQPPGSPQKKAQFLPLTLFSQKAPSLNRKRQNKYRKVHLLAEMYLEPSSQYSQHFHGDSWTHAGQGSV